MSRSTHSAYRRSAPVQSRQKQRRKLPRQSRQTCFAFEMLPKLGLTVTQRNARTAFFSAEDAVGSRSTKSLLRAKRAVGLQRPPRILSALCAEKGSPSRFLNCPDLAKARWRARLSLSRQAA